jgi:C-terminal processing protease CtpA/Prc
VLDQSPAKDAAIAVGDELVGIDGKEASTLSLAQIREMLRSQPGRRVELRVRRGERVVAQTITLRRMA